MEIEIKNRFESKTFSNQTKEEKEGLLKGYKPIASSTIYFDGRGNFIISNEATYAVAMLTEGKCEDAKKIVGKTLAKGADDLCTELRKCYVKIFEDTVKKVLGGIFDD